MRPLARCDGNSPHFSTHGRQISRDFVSTRGQGLARSSHINEPVAIVNHATALLRSPGELSLPPGANYADYSNSPGLAWCTRVETYLAAAIMSR